MHPREPKHASNGPVIVGGLGALIVAILVVLVLDPSPRQQPIASEVDPATQGAFAPAPHDEVGVQATAPRAELPAQATALLAQAEAVGVEIDTQLSEVVTDPQAHVDQRFACRVKFDVVATPWVDEGATPVAIRRALGAVAPFVLALSCEAEDLRVVPVDVFLAAGPSAPARSRSAGDVVALRLLGVRKGGRLLARHEALVSAGPVRALPGGGSVDLRRALLDGDGNWGRPLLCLSDGAPTFRDVRALTEADLALLRRPDEATSSGAPVGASVEPVVVAELRCRDGVGATVAALVRVPSGGDDILGVRASTQVALRGLGAHGGRVIAGFDGVVAGGADSDPTDLRRVLLRPVDYRGGAVTCVSMGVPLPEPIGKATIAPFHRTPAMAPVKAWLVCRQPSAPPAHVSLYFDEGQQQRLLRIGRGSHVRLRVLGAAGQRIFGSFVDVAEGGLDVSKAKEDLRRFVADPGRYRGTVFACEVSAFEALPDAIGARRPGAALVGEGVATAGRITCVDAVRPHSGQPFEVHFATAAHRDRAKRSVGGVLRLRFAGVAHGVAVASLPLSGVAGLR